MYHKSGWKEGLRVVACIISVVEGKASGMSYVS